MLSPAELGPIVDDAVRRKLTTLTAYRRVARDLSARGRRRSTITRSILNARTTERDLGESAPEARLLRLLVRAGLPRPIPQHKIKIGSRTVRVDFAYPEPRVVIEYDGWAFHGTRHAFDADRARGNELELLGYTVLRFTSASSDSDIVNAVSRALERRSAS
ncbi:MAG: DUF559 domain-containing protein [Acidimicrobiia bacterium]